MDTEEIVAKVLALYESDLLYEIIAYYGKKNDTGKFVSIDINGINEILEAYSFLNQKGGDEKPIKAIDDIISRNGFNYFIYKQSFCYATDIIKISNSDNRNCLNGLKLLKKSLTDIQFEFHPKNEEVFKRLFILLKQANRYYYIKGKDTPIKNVWTMSQTFSVKSDLRRCIFLSDYYRKYLSKGLYKIIIELPYCENYEDYTLKQVENEISEIKQHILEEKQKRIKHDWHLKTDRITKNYEELTSLPFSAHIEHEQQISKPKTLAIEEEYKIGCEFYKEGLYEKAQKHFSSLAEQGYPLAQKSLADMYFKGEGTEMDLAKALEWYEKAAEQGNDNVRLEIVNIYYDNDLFVKLKHLPTWLNEPFYLENTKANFLLGYTYFSGKGVNQDFPKALLLWQKVAIMGEAKSQFCLSCMYRDGIGVENDIEKAKELWDKCKDSLTLSAINNLNEIFPKNL